MAEFPTHDIPEDPSYDPRDIITPYAFELDEDLLGTELAKPSRRLFALLVDLLLAAILAQAGSVFVGLAVAFLFFRLATRQHIDQPLKRWARAMLAFFGALILFGTVMSFIGSDGDDASDPLTSAEQDSTQQATLDSVRNELRRHGVDAKELSRVPFMPRSVLDLVETTQSADTLSADKRKEAAALIRQYAQALVDDDQAARDTLRPAVATLAAGAQIDNLRRQLRQAEARIDELDDRNEELAQRAQNPGVWRMIRGTANDFGLRVGWIGVYFTIFLAWWNGQTPGKWLFGLRVVRLDGKSLTLWPAFERFGGYAAGIATGLIGFAQIYWDPNRQGVHDRIANTVVVRVYPDEESPDSDIQSGT